MDQQPPYCTPRQGAANGGNGTSSVRLPPSHLNPSAVPHPPPAMIFGQQPTAAMNVSQNYSVMDPYQRYEAPRATCNTPTRGNTRRLRVEDALSYLDQVKMQFSQAPEVYSDFLDIMKDFKSQTRILLAMLILDRGAVPAESLLVRGLPGQIASAKIDTPGVIRRVSRLFRGRPNLIVGFNTFLPPGFEVRLEGTKIVISEPSGRTQIIDEGRNETTTSVTKQSEAREASQKVQPRVCPVPLERVNPPSSGAQNASAALVVERTAPLPHVAAATESVPSVSMPCVDVKQHHAPASCVEFPSEQSPIEFNQAINYVNKIKARFQNRPDVYRQFLEILHCYQQEQKGTRAQGESQSLTEGQVYSSVAILFESEPDLLREFSQFLPDACGFLNKPSAPSNLQASETTRDSACKTKAARGSERATLVVSPQPVCVPNTNPPQPSPSGPSAAQCGTPHKRTLPKSSHQSVMAKKAKMNTTNVITYDFDVSEAVRLATVDDFLFFDKVRKVLCDDVVYNNFLRCLMLYNMNIVTKTELFELITPFIGKRANLLKEFKDLLGINDSSFGSQHQEDKSRKRPASDDGIPSELTSQIDYSTCKRLGISYRSLPDSYVRPVCTGRTPLCQSVLNDTWVSFPSWSSEDTSCVHSKKSQYEEFIYRTEDERYELDIVIEVNKAALETLEFLQRKMSRMKKEEVSKLRLDSSLGASSPSLMYRALKRIYGEHANKMLEGAQKNAWVVVPRLIERMRQKDREWRDAQVQFNRVWREQTEKYYAKSLDHQALSFKQNDLKLLRSKMIVHHFEMLYDERETRKEEGASTEIGPHCIYDYPEDMSVLYDVNDLVIHYVKRQPNVQKDEKRHAKKTLKRFLPELFNIPAQPMSDEEDNNAEPVRWEVAEADTSSGVGVSKRAAVAMTSEKWVAVLPASSVNDADSVTAEEMERKPYLGTSYRLFFGANTWCVFIRLHQMLCDRLARLKKKTSEMLANYKAEEEMRREREEIVRRNKGNGRAEHSTNTDAERGLHLLKKSAQCPENFYTALISEIKNLLDGQIEPSAFEDTIRNMFGTDAYITFTMDKIITTMGRQLQAMSTEEVNVGTMDLYQKYRFEKPLNTYGRSVNEERIEAAYQAAVEQLLANQNCFKTYFLHEKNKVTMELIDSDTVEEGAEKPLNNDHKWSLYARHYIKSLSEESPSFSTTSEEQQHFVEAIAEKPVFLMRLVRQGAERYRRKEEEAKKKGGKGRGKGRPSEKDKEREKANVIIKEDLHVHFSPTDNYHMRFVDGSSDILLRNGAPQRGAKKHKVMVARRKERFTSWLEERLCEEGSEVVAPRNWLSDGSKMVPVRHPVFHYLTYNRYVTTSDDSSSVTTARS
ncbi:Paired amphipathic helix protein Sin3a [Toxocara canis]|uniref:Paired amphipathic helix protein Sin3a n=1 Tax=Toxocara canis TaxID=6265 RepID=A0A0B2V262_TOXCA|nr:Paired amphipathic helix protein Sin3a [Toxocara canis]